MGHGLESSLRETLILKANLLISLTCSHLQLSSTYMVISKLWNKELFTWKLDEDFSIPVFPVRHLPGPTQSSVALSGLATTPIKRFIIWKPKIMDFFRFFILFMYLFLFCPASQQKRCRHLHQPPSRSEEKFPHQEMSAYKSEKKSVRLAQLAMWVSLMPEGPRLSLVAEVHYLSPFREL